MKTRKKRPRRKNLFGLHEKRPRCLQPSARVIGRGSPPSNRTVDGWATRCQTPSSQQVSSFALSYLVAFLYFFFKDFYRDPLYGRIPNGCRWHDCRQVLPVWPLWSVACCARYELFRVKIKKTTVVNCWYHSSMGPPFSSLYRRYIHIAASPIFMSWPKVSTRLLSIPF